MLKVVPGPQTRVIDTSFTIRVSGSKTKTNKGCAVGRRAEVTTKWLGKAVKKRNERTDEEKKKKVRWGRCALAAEQGSLKMHADRESFTRQFHRSKPNHLKRLSDLLVAQPDPLSCAAPV
jgi:hypothetical protein